MQVLLKKSDDRQELQCPLCSQGFRVYWERTSLVEQSAVRGTVLQALRNDHATDPSRAAHSDTPFTVPKWSGAPQFSGAALLGGLSSLHRSASAALEDFTTGK
jgi:hypothetical protein